MPYLHRSVAYRNLGNRLLAQVDIKAAFEAAPQDPDIRRAYAELNGGRIPSSSETNWSNSEEEQPLRAIIDRRESFGADEGKHQGIMRRHLIDQKTRPMTLNRIDDDPSAQ